jgi:hypothetical protein
VGPALTYTKYYPSIDPLNNFESDVLGIDDTAAAQQQGHEYFSSGEVFLTNATPTLQTRSARPSCNSQNVAPQRRSGSWLTDIQRLRRRLDRGVHHDRVGYRSDPFDIMPPRGANPHQMAQVMDYYARVLAPNIAAVCKIVSSHRMLLRL